MSVPPTDSGPAAGTAPGPLDAAPRCVVFVVTSTGLDRYAAMTRLATASLRISNPGLPVVLACDNPTAAALHATKDPLLSEVDELLAVDTPEGAATYRNRHVKTRLRSLLPGAFLFLDSDVLVRGPLDGLRAFPGDVAAAPNHSTDALSGQVWQADRDNLQAMGWEHGPTYFNGGVVLYRDSPGAHRFATEWHARWQASVERTGRLRDQPALNSALVASGAITATLPHAWNAQFIARWKAYHGAIIWHYYATVGLRPFLAVDLLVEEVMRTGRVPMQRLRATLHSGHPWRRAGWWDDLVARKAWERGGFTDEDLAWFSGRRLAALKDRVLGRLSGRPSRPADLTPPEPE